MKARSKYPLVDHMNRSYELGLFGLGKDGGPWGIRSKSGSLKDVDGGYFSEEFAEQSIQLMAEYGLNNLNVEIVKDVDGNWCNVW